MRSIDESGSTVEAAAEPLKIKPRRTTKRVIASALKVFSEQGLGATTKEIARVAGVNEVTLFRQFGTKENLLAAVTREICRHQSEALDKVDLENFDLRRDLTRIAEAYDHAVSSNIGFIRAMIAHPADPEMTEQITRQVAEPLRSKFLAYLEEARGRCVVCDLDLSPAVDAFTGMIFAGALRRDMKRQRYSRELYVSTCVELFVRGICHS